MKKTLFKFNHIALAAILAIGVCTQMGYSLSIKSVVSDTVFKGDESIRVELLESGDTLQTKYLNPFVFKLPVDTMWNICIANSKREKCYEVIYKGKDSIFTSDLGNTGYTIFELPDNSLQTEKIADSLNSDTLEAANIELGTVNTESETVTLKKVLMRVRKVPKRAPGKSTVSAKLMKRQPGLAEADVLRSIQNLPGVVASSDFSSKIYVRGGGSDQNLFLLDHGVVFSPVHFFGLFSTFLVEGIDEVDFYKGGFSTEYGNRLSSVVDIKARKGGDSTEALISKGSVKISTFASQAHIEGYENNLRYLWSGRITYLKQILDGLRSMGATDLNFDYFFYDLHTYLQYQISPKQSISILHYGGHDKLALTPIAIDWGNQLVPVNYDFELNDRWKLHALMAYSKFDQSFDLENIIGFENNIQLLNFKAEAIHTPEKSHTFKLGLETQHYNILFAQNVSVANIEVKETSYLHLYTAFLQHIWTPEPYKFDYGLRLTMPSSLPALGVEPRATISRNFAYDQNIDIHLGYYLQYINTVLFSDQETINEFYYPAGEVGNNRINPSSNLMLSVGYQKERLMDHYSFSLEGYYKSMENLLGINVTDDDDNVDKKLGEYFTQGVGYSTGYEVSFKKNDGWWNGGVSWSQGYSASLDEGDSVAYFPKWYQPWSLKIDGGFSWRDSDGLWKKNKKGRHFRSSTQLKFGSGLPYTDYIGYMPTNFIDQNEYGAQSGGPSPSFSDNYQIARGNRNMAMVSSYLRWDIKPVDWGVDGKWNFSWTILNITNHENVFLSFFDTDKNPPRKQDIMQFPFFPLLVNYEYYF